jgi:hypothetical protein
VFYPAQDQEEGWAWAGFGDAVEAVGLDNFVRGSLRGSRERAAGQAAEREGLQGEYEEQEWAEGRVDPEPSSSAAMGLEDLRAEGGEDDLLGRWLEQRPELQEMLEADRQAAASQYLNENKLRGKPAPVLVREWRGRGVGGF